MTSKELREQIDTLVVQREEISRKIVGLSLKLIKATTEERRNEALRETQTRGHDSQ